MDFILESIKLINAARHAMAGQNGSYICRGGGIASAFVIPENGNDVLVLANSQVQPTHTKDQSH